MKRIKKSLLIPLRYVAFRCKWSRWYYWADQRLSEMRGVVVMPQFYYRWLFRVSMRLVQVNGFRLLADRVIHRIPFHVRFNLA